MQAAGTEGGAHSGTSPVCSSAALTLELEQTLYLVSLTRPDRGIGSATFD